MSKNQSKSLPVYEGNQFRNPWDVDVGEILYSDVLKMFHEAKQQRRDDVAEIQSTMVQDTSASKQKIWEHYLSSTKSMRVTWIGHATVLFQMNGLNILTDPVWSDRCSPIPYVGPKRFFPPPFSLSELPPIHIVLVSHNHYDHLDKPTIKILGNEPKYFVPLGLKKWFLKRGIENCIEMNWWETFDFYNIEKTCTLKITCTPAQHFSSRTPFDKFETLWSSWVIEQTKTRKKLFFAGSTAYCPCFEEIGIEIGPFDFAAIPVGGFEPRWFMSNLNCNPEEAVMIHKDIRSKQSLAIQWGTFPLAGDTWNQAMEELGIAKVKSGVSCSKFVGCYPGKSFLIGVSSFEEFLEDQVDYGERSMITAFTS